MRGRPGVALVVAVATLCCAPGAAAAPPAPANLTVAGEDGWRADRAFQLTWTNPPVAAAHYRVRNPRGAIAVEEELPSSKGLAVALASPGLAGIYTAEVWLEDGEGRLGPPATAQLYFDDTPPGTVEPLPLPPWLGRGAFPLRVRLAHPSGGPPLSGIRGYAVSIDSSATGSPCRAATRCDETELTLPGGVENDELTIAGLPDGVTHLHAVAVSGTGVKSAQSGHAVLRVDTADPVTRLAGAPHGWTNGAVRLTATATDSGAGMAPHSGGAAPFTAIRVDAGAPRVAPGASASAELIAEGAHRVAYYARDAAGNVDDGMRSNGIRNRAPRAAWVRIDRTPPAAAFANSQDPGDPDLLRVRIEDGLSGADPARGWIGVRRAGSGDRFERLPAEPATTDELRARWHSDLYPRGRYEFRALAYDAAGNVRIAERRRDGAAMTLPSPLKATSALRAGFHRGRSRRAAPFGRRVRIAGRLTTGRSSPLGDRPLHIVETFAAGARPARRVTTVRTRPGGRFSHRLARGPSRRIAVSYAGGRTLARSSALLELRVRSRVRLRASSRVARVGGAPVVFRGRVLAAPGTMPRAGKAVQLQFRLPGLAWAAFRTLQTDRRGRFRYVYRFSDDDSRGVRFQFRAFAPAQEDWPYEPGGSRPVPIRGI
jgi:hypothetical protein